MHIFEPRRFRSLFSVVAAAVLVAPTFGGGYAAAAAGGLQVLTAKGLVSFNDKPVKTGDVLAAPGTLKTGSDGAAKVFARDAKTIAILKAGTTVVFPKDASGPVTFKLVEGLSRWVVGKIGRDRPITVATQSATMGVRGTDFLASYNSLLGESEVIDFAGSVSFSPAGKQAEAKTLRANQWGGVGGRFGASVERVLDLPPPVIAHFGGATEQETLLKGAKKNAEFHGQMMP